MAQSSLHDWLRPRLETLLHEAEAAGFAPEAALAVLIDLATGDAFNTAPLADELAPPHGPWPQPSDDRIVDASIGDIGLEPRPSLLGRMP